MLACFFLELFFVGWVAQLIWANGKWVFKSSNLNNRVKILI